MSVEATKPSKAAPYRRQWTAASDDITSTTAASAPMVFPAGVLDSQNALNLSIGTLVAGVTAKFELIMVDERLSDASDDQTVIRSIPIEAVVPAAPRRTSGDGTAGYYFAPDIIVDIRGVQSSGQDIRWYLCCTDVAATTVRLFRFGGTKAAR